MRGQVSSCRTVRSVERLAVLVTSFKAAVDASYSSSSSSTESLRLASSSPGFSMAGSLSLKSVMHLILYFARTGLLRRTTADFPFLRLTAVAVALSVGFCVFALRFPGAVQRSKSITLAL